jgi:hypothetical protein
VTDPRLTVWSSRETLRSVRAVLVAVAVVLAASVVRAEERAARTFSLKASSVAECPAIESFSRRVLARTSRARLATSESADVAFVLSVAPDPEGASGTLGVTEGATQSVRSVRGASCEEVVDALALIAAVTLDPDASTEPIVLDAPPEPTKERPAQPTQALPPASPRVSPPATRSNEFVAPGLSWRFGGGVRGALSQGLAPDPVFALGAFVSALLPGEGSSLEPLFLAGIWLGRSAEYDATNRGGEQLGTAQFRWLAGDIIGCPLRLPATGALAVRPCLGFEAGQLTGKGRAAKNSAEESATWLAMTGSARLDWTVFDVLQIDLTGGGFLSLTRDDFFFEPAPGSAGTEGVVVHEIPAGGLRASIGVGALFP